ncbi:MAG: hypothetical protein ABSG91_21695 [Syntrophobacteraceae bacterium]
MDSFRIRLDNERGISVAHEGSKACDKAPGSHRSGIFQYDSKYLVSKDQSLSKLDEAVFELAHFVSDMAQVDGAVVMTRRLELIGFGAEISGKLNRVDTIAQVLDPEGLETRLDQNDYEGTRHHSAYSLCNVLHDVLVVVISQDGTVQVVKWNKGIVTVWDLVSPGLIYA